MEVWTVDTWRVAPERQGHFLDHCRALSPGPVTLFRDVEEEWLFWSPAKWESLEALRTWRESEGYRAAVRRLEIDVIEHHTHVMTDVPGFAARSGDSGGTGPEGPTGSP